jgi:hypothetical protein
MKCYMCGIPATHSFNGGFSCAAHVAGIEGRGIKVFEIAAPQPAPAKPKAKKTAKRGKKKKA